LEFYVDDNMTVIPFSNNSWIQESVDVSGYSGDHNITLRLYSMCPGLMTGHQSTVEIDDISLVPTPDDWNPWNDADSDGGALITTPELQEVVITGLMTSHPANHRPPAGVPLHQSPFHKSTQTAPFQVIMSHLTALLL
jgi:hypothetical protein